VGRLGGREREHSEALVSAHGVGKHGGSETPLSSDGDSGASTLGLEESLLVKAGSNGLLLAESVGWV